MFSNISLLEQSRTNRINQLIYTNDKYLVFSGEIKRRVGKDIKVCLGQASHCSADGASLSPRPYAQKGQQSPPCRCIKRFHT